MNTLGWILTILLSVSTLLNINRQYLKCRCFPPEMPSAAAETEKCQFGRRFAKTDKMSLSPLGSCYDTSFDYLGVIWWCLVEKDCWDHLAFVLKALTTMLLPFFLEDARRLVVHALLNAVTMRMGSLVLQSRFDSVCAVIVLVGTFVFTWNIGNGAGLFGFGRRRNARAP